jgi:hypothetical protein
MRGGGGGAQVPPDSSHWRPSPRGRLEGRLARRRAPSDTRDAAHCWRTFLAGGGARHQRQLARVGFQRRGRDDDDVVQLH